MIMMEIGVIKIREITMGDGMIRKVIVLDMFHCINISNLRNLLLTKKVFGPKICLPVFTTKFKEQINGIEEMKLDFSSLYRTMTSHLASIKQFETQLEKISTQLNKGKKWVC